jgi:hypothetical protein
MNRDEAEEMDEMEDALAKARGRAACLTTQVAKLTTDLSAALAERDEARRSLVMLTSEHTNHVGDFPEDHQRKVAATLFGAAESRRLFPAPTDPEGGPTE